MCVPLIFLVFQVLKLECTIAYPYKDYIIAYIPIEEFAYLSSMTIDAIAVPYYSNVVYADPRSTEGMLLNNFWSSYLPTTTGPVSFRSQVKAEGAVSVSGGYGNQGFTCTSYSAPATPIIVTTQLETPTDTTLPTVTTLPVAALPSPCTLENEPSIVTVPSTSLPVIIEAATVASVPVETGNIVVISEIDVVGDLESDASVPVASMPVASPVAFSGMVPASGRVKICATFC